MKPYGHFAALPDDQLLAQCRVSTGRSSGPGGQHRNKVETLVMLCHEPTGVEAHAGERRSQADNKRVALRRLRLALATARREGVPIGEIGSDLWKSRVRDQRISISPDHHDFPALLAEALDAIADAGWKPRKAAVRLETTVSQLTRLIKDHPPAFIMWNDQRAQRGLPRLK